MVVSLVNYDALGETGIYLNKDFERIRVGSQFVHVKKVFELKRFGTPSEDDVVNLIIEKAYELRKNPDKEAVEGSLEGKLKKLPEGFLEDIRNRNPEAVLFLRQNTSAPRLKEGEEGAERVFFRYSLLLDETVEKLRRTPENGINLLKTVTAQELLDVGLGYQWDASALLMEGLLPSRKSIRTLLGAQVIDSYVLQISAEEFKEETWEEIGAFFNLLYRSIPTRDKVKEVKDRTDIVLEVLAREPIDKKLGEKIPQEQLERSERKLNVRVPTYMIPNNLPN